MKFDKNNRNPVLSQLIATLDDLRDPEFVNEIEVADMVIALSRHDQDMEVLWGEVVPQRLITGLMKNLSIAYIAVDFDTDEREQVVDAVRTIKEDLGNAKTDPRLSLDSGSRKRNGSSICRSVWNIASDRQV